MQQPVDLLGPSSTLTTSTLTTTTTPLHPFSAGTPACHKLSFAKIVKLRLLPASRLRESSPFSSLSLSDSFFFSVCALQTGMMLVRRDIFECFSETDRANMLTPLNRVLFSSSPSSSSLHSAPVSCGGALLRHICSSDRTIVTPPLTLRLPPFEASERLLKPPQSKNTSRLIESPYVPGSVCPNRHLVRLL